MISIPANICSLREPHTQIFAGGIRQRAGNVLDEVDTQVHFEPGETLLLALLEAIAVDVWIVRFGGVRVTAYFVAELSAEHLIDGNVVSFARQIPQRHFDGADASALARVKSELLYFAENFVDVAGIFTQNATFEHQCISLRRAVANLAQAINPLICIDANHRAGHRRAGHRGYAQVGNFELGRFGSGVGVLHHRIEGVASPDGRGSNADRTLQEATSGVEAFHHGVQTSPCWVYYT